MRKNLLGLVAKILLIIGGLNWGLEGAMDYDLVAELFGDMSVTSRVIYVLVGLGALYFIVGLLAKATGHAAFRE